MLRRARFRVCAVLLVLSAALLSCSSPEEKKARHFERGTAYLQQQKLKEAVIEFRNVVQIDPKDSDGYYQLALAYLQLGSAQDAFSAFQKTVDVAPDNDDARLRLAQLMLLAKRLDEADRHVELLLAKEGAGADPLLLKGAILLEKGDLDGAVAVFERAERVAPEDSRVFMALAGAASRKGDLKAAESHLKRAVAVSEKGTAQSRSRLALAALYDSAGKQAQAEEEMLAIMGDNPGEVEMSLILARFYMRHGRDRDAERILKEAAEEFPQAPDPLVALGELQAKKGDLPGAAGTLEDALILSPQDPNIRARLAAIEYDLGQHAEAMDRAEAVLKDVPSQSVALLVKAKVAISHKDFKTAVSSLSEILKRQPENPEALYFRALSYLKSDESVKAEADLRKLLAGWPGFLKARLMLAELALRERKPEVVREQTEAVLMHVPAETRALTLQAAARMMQKDWTGAEADLRKTLETAPEDLTAHFLLGRVFMALKRFAEAENALQYVLSRNTGHLPALTSLVDIALYEKRPETAVEFCRKLEERDPRNASIVLVKGGVLLRMGRWDEAEAAFKRALSLDSDLVGPYMALASLYKQTGKLDKAIGKYRALLEKNPNFLTAHMAIGILEEQSGRTEAAEASYRKALSLKEDFAPAANNLAWLLAKTGDLEEAFIYAQKAKSAAPEQPAILDTVGWILTKKGSYQLAVSNFEEALKKWPDQPTIQYHLAVALAGMKDFGGARDALEKALQSQAEFPEAEEARRLLHELS